jgi:hypothetical protein
MRTATLLLALLPTAALCADEKKDAPTRVLLADLLRDPAKYAGRMVQFEGIVEETPARTSSELRLERANFAIDCEDLPKVVVGDRVRVTAVCEVSGKPPRLKLRDAVATKLPRLDPIHLTVVELMKNPKEFDGKVIALEGVLRATPEAVEFGGEVRYGPRLSAGLNIICRGQPNARKGERIRITGTLTVSKDPFDPLILEATKVEVLPK